MTNASLTPSNTPMANTSISGTRTVSGGQIRVVGGPVPVDVNRVWNRVQNLLGTNVAPPESVVFSPSTETTTLRPTRFYTALTSPGFWTPQAGTLRGQVQDPDTVHIYLSPNASTPGEIEQILAHEFAHVVQFRQNVPTELRYTKTISGALLQGGAIYVADIYTERYLEDTIRPSTRVLEAYTVASPVERYFMRQNYFGYRYVTARVHSPRNLSEVYRQAPKTTEQLVHRLAPDEEPPVPLRVTVERPDSGGWLWTGNGTTGELLIRSVLETRLSHSTAVEAAKGWGNDRLVTFWNGTTYSYVWVVRADDTRNSREFAAAFERYLDAWATRTDAGWRRNGTVVTTERLDPETVAIVVGDREFTRNVSVSAS